MKILGVDFSSSPSRRKPIVVMAAVLRSTELVATEIRRLESLEAFAQWLETPGPWVAGLDFPFGQSRRFIENVGWPQGWQQYVAALQRDSFYQLLNDYRQGRPAGDKEHRRACDIAAGAISPQKLFGVPVGKMFYEGATRLLEAGVSIPGVIAGDPQRVCVEAYPGYLARRYIGRTPYKNDARSKQTAGQLEARHQLFHQLRGEALERDYGLSLQADTAVVTDPQGDELDALLCCIQAAWAYQQRQQGWGAPRGMDCSEGYIADPGVLAKMDGSDD